MDVDRIQNALRENNLDGWLFFDHHRRDPLAYRILGVPDSVGASRRWYYFIPASGEPRKLVHQIESGNLDTLPGLKQPYASWADQRKHLATMLAGSKRIAMQYSPDCAIPYVSLVDAGTIELVRSCGAEVVSSADLVQQFEAIWSAEQFATHIEAGRLVDQVRREAFEFAGERLRATSPVTEYEVQQFIRRRFQELDLYTDHGPIVSVNSNASDAHYEPSCERHSHIRRGDLVLIDMWAKKNVPYSVYYDITWTGFCGDPVPERIQNVFAIVRTARERACDFVIAATTQKRQFCGFEVDDAARNYICEQGYGENFFHRTGHSIGTEVHGTGANMDNLESHDERRVIANTGFSVEPGIYLQEFGIRSEVNMFVGQDSAQVTGEEQKELVRI
jgi:Xaa-Pro aminopeptidase